MYLQLLVVNNSEMHTMTCGSGTIRFQSQLGKVAVVLSLLFLRLDTCRWKKSGLWKFLPRYFVYVDMVREPLKVISRDVLRSTTQLK